MHRIGISLITGGVSRKLFLHLRPPLQTVRCIDGLGVIMRSATTSTARLDNNPGAVRAGWP